MMSDIKESIVDLVGNTPLLRINNIIKKYDLKADILVKLESFNPAGSAKDRIAKEMIFHALEKGSINKDTTLIEPTSGNTGIGLAAIAASLKMKCVIIMPDSMSIERINMMKAYGAKVILTPGSEGMKGSIDKANELVKTIDNSMIVGQFDNPDNPLAHYKTTGPEIFQQTDGKVDIFVSSIGTGGTISGTGKYLKEKIPGIHIVGVEPASSPLLSKGKAGPHQIQGIGANFIPKALDQDIYDEIITIEDDDAFLTGKDIARTEGILVGISSGATLHAAIQLARKEDNEGKTIVAILTDGGDRYLSTPLIQE